MNDIANPQTATLSLRDFIQLCGITGITSDAIFFAPNIPREKLTNALKTYGNGTLENEVIILIDDTFWGGAKEGILITEESLLFNEKDNKPRQIKLNILQEVSSSENEIVLDGRYVGKLSKAGKLELGYVFSVIDTYIKTKRQSASAREKNSFLIDKNLVIKVCISHIKPEYFLDKESSNFTKPTTMPNYYVGETIPKDLEGMLRFYLSLPSSEKVIAFSDLSRNKTGEGCFVITDEGLYSKREGEQNVLYVPWSKLKELTIVSEHKESYLCGVILSNGQALATSWNNVVVRPFGVKLLNDLIDVLNAKKPIDNEDTSLPASKPTNKDGEEKTSLQHQDMLGKNVYFFDETLNELVSILENYASKDIDSLNPNEAMKFATLYFAGIILEKCRLLPEFVCNNINATEEDKREIHQIFGLDEATLATLTYISSFIYFLLQNKADYTFEKAQKFFVIPFTLIASFAQQNQPKSLKSVANKSANIKDSKEFRNCDIRFGDLYQHFQAEADSVFPFLFFVRDLTFEKMSLPSFTYFSLIEKRPDLLKALDEYLQCISDDIEKELIDLVETCNRLNLPPTGDAHMACPSKLFFGRSPENMRPRVKY
ncbi:hypothetical protein CRENPOLYSF2_400003 [Crenothrix polyspora]|uniref:Uncharacterized protein n=1 Tax=Crenothrix polyspora TaxID=360316 RepID=A0A1R4HDZ6_9GAMM|nr:hypothetical protein [Crenothrix polyspora]SJM94452.1 hypothetical protein CRENPOLYSF2_400003 [Crenothrix polyspora]